MLESCATDVRRITVNKIVGGGYIIIIIIINSARPPGSVGYFWTWYHTRLHADKNKQKNDSRYICTILLTEILLHIYTIIHTYLYTKIYHNIVRWFLLIIIYSRYLPSYQNWKNMSKNIIFVTIILYWNIIFNRHCCIWNYYYFNAY